MAKGCEDNLGSSETVVPDAADSQDQCREGEAGGGEIRGRGGAVSTVSPGSDGGDENDETAGSLALPARPTEIMATAAEPSSDLVLKDADACAADGNVPNYNMGSNSDPVTLHTNEQGSSSDRDSSTNDLQSETTAIAAISDVAVTEIAIGIVAAADTDIFLNDLDDRVRQKLQLDGNHASIIRNNDVDAVQEPAEDVSQQQQQQGREQLQETQQQLHNGKQQSPIVAPGVVAIASTNQVTQVAAGQLQPDEKVIESARTPAAVDVATTAAASSPSTGQSIEQLVPGAYATAGRPAFAHTMPASLSYYTSSMHSRDITNMPTTNTNSLASSLMGDAPPEIEGTLELTAICVDDGNLEDQIRAEIIQSAPQADAVHADVEDSASDASIGRRLRKSRRRCVFGTGICLILLGVLVGASLIAGGFGRGSYTSSNSDSDSGKETAPDGKESFEGDGDGWIELLQYEGVMRCGVVGDPSWDSSSNSNLKVENVVQRSQEVDTASGSFRDLTNWEAAKLLDQAATNKEYDICRAIAAAIFGESWPKKLKIAHDWNWHASSYESYSDVYVGTMSPTIGNDLLVATAGDGFSFSTPYYYQGLRYSGRPADVNCAEALSGGGNIGCNSTMSICVRETSLALEDNSIYPGLGSVPSTRIVVLRQDEDVFAGLVNGTCSVLADYGAALFEGSAREAGFTDEYIIGNAIVSKEPRVISYYDKLPDFNIFLKWVLLSLFAAAQEGITQDIAEEIGEVQAFDDTKRYAMINAIKAVGNMEEILVRDGINMEGGIPMDGGSNGFIIPNPTGPTRYRGRLGSKGVLHEVIKRGRLQCAIQTNRLGFAVREGDTYEGMDVDYCKAVAGAVFGSNSGLPPVDLIEIAKPEDGVELVLSGKVDVVAGATWSLPGETPDPVTGLTLGFTQPYFFRPAGSEASILQDHFCMATLNKDPQWRSFVHWVVSATITAEERGILQETAEFMSTVDLFESDQETMLQSAIAAVGNFGEIYARNLEVRIPRSGPNLLNRNPQTSLQGPATYIPPGLFR